MQPTLDFSRAKVAGRAFYESARFLHFWDPVCEVHDTQSLLT